MHAYHQQQRKGAIHSAAKTGFPVPRLQKKQVVNINFFKSLFPGIISLLILSLLPAPKAYAQDATDYAIHANIIYRFTKYIDWPAEKKTGDFVIGIVGETPLYGELKKFIINKTVGRQKIVVERFSSSAGSFDCNILFIGVEESSHLKKIARQTAGTSILLVSESEGLAEKGACINFIIVSDHLKLEINKTNIQQRNLLVASELLQLGKIIK